MQKKLKFGVLLSGSGVYDGSEIHEAVCLLLALDRAGVEAVCMAPDVEQAHVINHTNGQTMPEKRNVLIEAARIARGNIQEVSSVNVEELDALMMPGGFGAAKNLSNWAFEGAQGTVLQSVKELILAFHKAAKPIGSVCISPVVLAKAFEGSGTSIELTVGSTAAPSPYDIAQTNEQLEQTGARAVMKTVDEIQIDEANRIVTSPCYMMEASISEIYQGVEKTVQKIIEMVQGR